MSIFDSQKFGEEQIVSRVEYLEAQVEDLQSPMQNILASTIEISDANTVIDENGLSMNEETLIHDGKWVADLINNTLDTQTQQILGEFTFSSSGALKIATDDNNGTWISPTGILGKKSGSTTFALDNNGNLTMKGTLLAGSVIAANISADLINAGTLVGRTVKATGGDGVDTWLQNNGQLLFRYGNSTKAYMQSDSSGRLIIDGDASITLQSTGDGDDIILDAGARVTIKSKNKIEFKYNTDGGSDDVEWISDGTRRMILNQDGVLDVDSGFSVNGDDGVDKDDDSVRFVTSVWQDGDDLKYNWRQLYFTGGILTGVGSENTSTACDNCLT